MRRNVIFCGILCVLVIIIAIAFITSNRKNNLVELSVNSFYDESGGVFKISDFTPGMTVQDVLQFLDIDAEDINFSDSMDRSAESCPYTYGYPNYRGETRLNSKKEDFAIAGIPATSSLLFFDEKLVGVTYRLVFNREGDAERKRIINELIADFSGYYSFLDSSSAPIYNPDIQTHIWYNEYEESKYSLLRITMTEDDSGDWGLYATITVYIDINEADSAMPRVF